MWTGVLHSLLTTLRYLAPATLLVIFWGHDSFLFKVLRQLEAALRSIIYSSDKQSALVLQWVSDSSAVQVTCLDHVWRHGWLLCGVIERALPGACGGHPHAPLSIEHAQTLAEQYLGVQPVFSRQEFESTEVLTKRQEWKLAHYLDRMRQALGRLSPPVSKPNSPRIAHDTQAYTLDYVARGVGLCAAQTNRKMCFKIYPTAQQCLEPGEINVLVRGPGDTFGTAPVPPIYGRAQLLRQAFLGLDVKSQYTQGSLPLTQGTAYFRSYGKNDMNKTFHIPRAKQDIEIEVSVRRDHAKVTYSAGLEGIYEISLTSRGYNLIGSPFRVCASEDNMECNTSTDLDDDEECGIVDVKNDRRVVFRIVDFVTEKMLLNDNGSLEKITDEEANELISNAKSDRISDIDDELQESLKQLDLIENDIKTNEHACKRFKSATTKIITMINVCDSFKATINKNKNKINSELEGNITSHRDIPDIVHSMIFDKKGSTDAKIPDHITLETDTIYMVENNSPNDAVSPRQIELDDKCYENDCNETIITNFTHNSVRYGKSDKNEVITACQSELDHKFYYEEPIEMVITNVNNKIVQCDNLVQSEIVSPSKLDEKLYNNDPSETIITNIHDNSVRYEKPMLISQKCIELDSPQNLYVSSISDNTSDTYYSFSEDNESESKLFSKNPFLCEIPEDHEGILETENMKSVGNSITCNPFKDELIDEDTNIILTADNPIQILVDIDEEELQVPTNPFIDVNMLERPKTPILKIITGEIKDRNDSIYVDPKFELPDDNVTSYDELRKSNEFLNPFFYHNSVEATSLMPPPTADFIIGAPVSLPPFLKAPSPEPDMDSIILASNLEEALHKYDKRVQNMVQTESTEGCESLFSTPMPMTPTNKFALEETCSDIESTFHSTEYYANEPVECTNQTIKIPHKDLWDSAYVSIDEPNSSPDSNNNSEITNKIKVIDGDDFFNMGPAEREIWQKCADIKTDSVDLHEQDIYQLPEHKRSTITTILEENEKSIPTLQSHLVDKEPVCTTKEPEDNEQDSITVALSELNNVYKEYFISSESNSLSVVPEKEKFQSMEVNFAISDDEYDVNSASEPKSDVKRHSEYEDAAAISEVQSYATESFSASRALEDSLNDANKDALVRHDFTIFGDKPSGKLVNERKKYWDEKIKAIEEIKAQQQRKRKITSKHLKLNDSLSKRKGKHVAKNLIHLAESEPSNQKQLKSKEHVEPISEPQTEIKLVDKWKRYWDERLITTEETTSLYVPENKVNYTKPSTSPVRIPVPPTKHSTSPVNTTVPPTKHSTSPLRIPVPPTKQLMSPVRIPVPPTKHLTSPVRTESLPPASENNQILIQNDSGESTPEETLPQPEIHSPIKHDITDEQVFKAFETSPKRFFGNSRKHILEKIDAFLGKPNPGDKETVNIPGVRCNLGIVSSRISMFNIDTENEDNAYKHKDILLGTNMQKRPPVSETYLNKITIIDTIETTKSLSLKHVEICDDNCVTDKTEPMSDKTEPMSEKTDKVKNKIEKFRKLSTSKSEMDIFNRTQTKSKDLDSHKSCEDLYRVSVRNFISLFENVTKTEPIVKPNNNNEDNNLPSTADSITPIKDLSFQSQNTDECTVLPMEVVLPEQPRVKPILEERGSLNVSNDVAEVVSQHLPTKTPTNDDVEENNDKDKRNVAKCQSPDEEPETIEYKQRFKMAKQFFQSLEELKNDDADKPQKLNECEMILYSQSTESLPQTPKLKKKTVRAHSVPTSDCEYDPNSVGEQWESYGTGAGGRRLIKISEKFQVEDLFNDVAGDGKLSRRGSFRGIPHKHAVLATFKSMENVTDSQMTSYEMSVSQLSDFAKENQIKNAQTYLTEYPYLPRTEPSKYRSRLDNKASGLISRKELLKHHMRPRRNSVPDALRLNERFTATL